MNSTHVESDGGVRVTIQHCLVCDVFLGVNYPSDYCDECKTRLDTAHNN